MWLYPRSIRIHRLREVTTATWVDSNYHGPATPTGVIHGSNTFGFTGQGQDTFNPRLGFSYLLPGTDRQVLRGGEGLYHTTPEGQLTLQLSSEQPYGSFSNTAGVADANATDANPFPAAPVFPVFTPYSPNRLHPGCIAQDFRPPSTYH